MRFTVSAVAGAWAEEDSRELVEIRAWLRTEGLHAVGFAESTSPQTCEAITPLGPDRST